MMQVKRNTEKEVNENGKNKSLNCACISCSKDFLGDTVKTSSEVLPGYYLNYLFSFQSLWKGNTNKNTINIWIWNIWSLNRFYSAAYVQVDGEALTWLDMEFDLWDQIISCMEVVSFRFFFQIYMRPSGSSLDFQWNYLFPSILFILNKTECFRNGIKHQNYNTTTILQI